MMRRKHNPKAPTLFIVDEMAHLGALAALEQAVTLMRGYGVRLVMLLQNLGQLKKLYPGDSGTIVANCATLATFGMTSNLMAGAMADCLGDLSAETLMSLGDGKLAVRRRGGPTRVLGKADYLKDRRFAGMFEINPRFAEADCDRRVEGPEARSEWNVPTRNGGSP